MSHLDEDALRALVRESVARHLARGEALPRDAGAQPLPVHASHSRYRLAKTDGPCLIEPSVPCNGCGYCESHGH